MNLIDAFNQAGLFAKLTLLVGFVPLGLALWYVFRPSERTLVVLRPVSLATIFAAISGTVAGFIAVLMGLPPTMPQQPNLSTVYQGLAEALVPAFMNFGLLAVTWLLAAVGMMRRPRLPGTVVEAAETPPRSGPGTQSAVPRPRHDTSS